MKTFIFPGSFDPFSLGHIDIAKRASRLCDKLVVAVMINRAKNSLFTVEERVEMAKICLKDVPNIEVISRESLLVDVYRELGASAVVRGLRSESDFRYEAEMNAANTLMFPDYQVIFLPCRADLAFTSSSIIKEVAYYGGDISRMCVPQIEEMVHKKLLEKQAEK
ncbi:MAG: pantetheine-phosphate adenylyltransferase [Clostridiales bacterium]|nr:pantetheine-phosphate adenylyltransferase [Clostridiales bacterium]MBQ6270776.1 pantetheine-phosphate adenylyltransferase [Clostridiales bacterium]MCR5057464.1 pantetheine-phosphate adenylyltransferase [Clostridiales bacterium]